MKNKKEHIYFIGIGGISMSALAEILVTRGFQVSGTDMQESNTTKKLIEKNVHINYGHRAENITDDVTLVVYTAAIHADNPELQAAKQKHIPTMDRAHLLGKIMNEYPNAIAVSGTHGKTTTTSMVSEILIEADTDPTITVGGILPTIGSNLKIGRSPYFVAEACEYFDSFLQFSPKVGVILNVESDHLDYFKDLAHIRHSFHQFAQRIPKNGLLVISNDIENVQELTTNLQCQVETFGLSEQSNWQAIHITHDANGRSRFDVLHNGVLFATIQLHIPGEHNITNALAAIAATAYFGITPEQCQKGLWHYTGTQRRFQYKGTRNGITVVDDYAHHPTELKAALSAAQNIAHEKTWCVFQPHTFSRTKFLFDEFAEAFSDADEIIIADIYAARETDDGSISAKDLAERISQTGKHAQYVGDFAQIGQFLRTHCQTGDLLMTVGAGDVYKIGEQFLQE